MTPAADQSQSLSVAGMLSRRVSYLPSMRPASGIGEPAPARAYCLVLYGASDHAP